MAGELMTYTEVVSDESYVRKIAVEGTVTKDDPRDLGEFHVALTLGSQEGQKDLSEHQIPAILEALEDLYVRSCR